MPKVEMFTHIKMRSKGFSGNNGNTTLRAPVSCLSCGSPGLSADSRTEPAVWHPNGLFSCGVIKYSVCVFLSKLVLVKEGKSDAKILPALEW